MDVYGIYIYIYIYISLMDSNGVTGCDRHKLITTVWHNIVAAKAPTSIRLQFFLYFATGSPLGETQTDARLWVTWSRDVSCSPNSGCLLFLQPWEVAQRNSSHHLRTMPSRGSPPTSQNPPWNHSLYCKILQVKNQHPYYIDLPGWWFDTQTVFVIFVTGGNHPKYGCTRYWNHQFHMMGHVLTILKNDGVRPHRPVVPHKAVAEVSKIGNL